jgi:hypothetical protein
MQLIHSTNDGMQFHGHDNLPVWVKVIPHQEGRHPHGDHWQWIRLDTITAVIPHLSVQVGDNQAEWQRCLIVETANGRFHPSALLFKGAEINAPLERLLAAISQRYVR